MARARENDKQPAGTGGEPGAETVLREGERVSELRLCYEESVILSSVCPIAAICDFSSSSVDWRLTLQRLRLLTMPRRPAVLQLLQRRLLGLR